MKIGQPLFKILLLAILLAFFVGPYFLENIGIQYVSSGGNFLFKINFYSYLIILTVLYFLFTGKRKQYLRNLTYLKPYWIFCITCVIFVITYGLLRQGMSGMAYLVDTFLTPLLIIPLILMLEKKQCEKLVTFLAWLILFNSSIAILEFSLNKAIIPVEIANFSHFRSTAFLAHPLNNALITASLAPVLLTKTKVPPMIYFAIVMLSLFSFGGRGAMGIFLAGSIITSLPAIKQFFITGLRISKLRFSFYQLGFYFVVIVLAYTLIMTPIGDRILSKMYIDTSAKARFDVFYILEEMSLKDWIFGASYEIKGNIDDIIGQNTIENYFIGWLVSFGLLGAIPLFLSVFLIPIRVAVNMPIAVKISVITLFLVSISNNALSVKTTVLLFVFSTFACLAQRRE